MYLRQSTASQEISLGQFLDSTDGDTEEGGLTIANTDIKIRKHGTTTLANKNSGGATVISNGVYQCTLDATDTDTAGMMEIYVHVTGALAVKSTFSVLTATAFDALFTGTFNNLGGTAQTADHTAGIAGIPTVSEFNARTIVSANYALEATLADIQGATFNTSTDSLEAIRDRGDAAWTTGGGGGSGGIAVTQQILTRAKGDTSQIIPFSAQDSSSSVGGKLTALVFNTANLVASYNRIGAAGAATTITLVAATKGTYTSSGFVAIDGTNMAGDYELHIPDAALATGADGVQISISGAANMVPVEIYIDLVANMDLGSDNRVLVSANAHTSGQTIAAVTGGATAAAQTTAQNDLDIITDSDGVILGSAGVDLIWDENLSGHQSVLTSGRALTLGGVPIAETTAAGTPTTTTVQLAAGSLSDDFYNDQTFKILSGSGLGQARIVSDYVGSTRTCTFDEPFIIAPANGDSVGIALDHVHPVTEIQSGLATSAEVAALPTVGAIADQVWDELIAGHAISGSTGEALSAAGAAGDPWITALPGSYSAGQAGKIVGDNIDALISSRNAIAPLDAAATRAALGLATANMDTQFTASVTATGFATPTNITAASGIVLAGVTHTGAVIPVVTTNTDMRGTDSALLASSYTTNVNVATINGVTIIGDGSGTPFDV